MDPVVSFTLEDASPRLDLFLSRQTGRSRVFVQSQIRAGFVQVNEEAVTKSAHKLKSGDRVAAAFHEDRPIDLIPIPGNLEILFEDEALLVINKRQGVVVHPAVGHRGETLVHHLLHHLGGDTGFAGLSPARPGIVHRLDRGTSGVLIVAKSRPALESLARQFKDRTVRKEYEAVVWGAMPPEGSIRSEIGRDMRDRKKMSSRTASGRDALTRWRKVAAYPCLSHVALFPHTGRTHQLRVHLAESGHPIVSDPLYGRGRAPRRISIVSQAVASVIEKAAHPFLHARALAFTHPTSGAPMLCQAARPARFDELLERLRAEAP